MKQTIWAKEPKHLNILKALPLPHICVQNKPVKCHHREVHLALMCSLWPQCELAFWVGKQTGHKHCRKSNFEELKRGKYFNTLYIIIIEFAILSSNTDKIVNNGDFLLYA